MAGSADAAVGARTAAVRAHEIKQVRFMVTIISSNGKIPGTLAR